MKVMYERVAGIDVHKDMIKVAIRFPGEKGTRKTEVLEFRTFWGVLQEVARELRRRGVTHVAMEASGVYTEPVYHAHFRELAVCGRAVEIGWDQAAVPEPAARRRDRGGTGIPRPPA